MRGKNVADGATRVSANGYHYTKVGGKWHPTGRLVAGTARGRPLEKNERIRYKDEDRSNNDPTNIVVYTVKEGSKAKRIAQLEAKIEAAQAELEELRAEA